MANTIQADGQANSTAIVLTAKHGQSPLNNSQLQRIDDGPIISGVNAAWAATHRSNPTLVVQEADDDGMLWWLSDRSQAATEFVKDYLWSHSAPAVNYAGQTITVQHSGLPRSSPARSRRNTSASRTPTRGTRTCSGSRRSARSTRAARRSPNTVAPTRATGTPLVVYAPGTVQPSQSNNGVETTQVAPTILKLLGLSPGSLQSVQEQGAPVLPNRQRERDGQ